VKASLTQEWLVVLGLALAPVTVLEVTKLIYAAWRLRAADRESCGDDSLRLSRNG
jgi:hypothetical protein